MRLAALQQLFQTHVLQGKPDITAYVPGTDTFSTPTRLSIYTNAFHARLCEALAKNYPALQFVLGEPGFADLTHAYATHAPSRHFSIRYFGHELATFIRSTYSDVQAITLSDLARFEWALCAAFDALDAQPLDKTILTTVQPDAWGQVRFIFAPAIQRIDVQSNAIQWWRTYAEGAPRPSAQELSPTVHWLLWRTQLATQFRSLPEDETQALDALLQGQTFAVMCERLAQHVEQAPLRAATLLQYWFDAGMIIGLQQY